MRIAGASASFLCSWPARLRSSFNSGPGRRVRCSRSPIVCRGVAYAVTLRTRTPARLAALSKHLPAAADAYDSAWLTRGTGEVAIPRGELAPTEHRTKPPCWVRPMTREDARRGTRRPRDGAALSEDWRTCAKLVRGCILSFWGSAYPAPIPPLPPASLSPTPPTLPTPLPPQAGSTRAWRRSSQSLSARING
eukprot:363918-Chlamydomonas_euryale.AAC.7